ncbi:hypothetical protein [Sphingobacterium cellulitidis]|uniref:hypothetical protein n=1 Tax=Sphingobacterium cellulitidis TaxID=1768011 RepID=UPI000B944487|nr:hypothetical protein CHT99_10465 [Sphingobacterium cellulitidis]
MKSLTIPRPKSLLEKKKLALFQDLATIHILGKIIQIGYYSSIKGTNFLKPQIASKGDQIHKLSEDIIKSLGEAVRLKEDKAEYMEYEHFTEVYELIKSLVFLDTQSISNLTKVIQEEREKTHEKLKKE